MVKPVAHVMKPNQFAQHDEPLQLGRRLALPSQELFKPSNGAEALLQRLSLLPQPTVIKGKDGQLNVLPNHPLIGRKAQQVEEYASLERLDAMIEFTKKSVQSAVDYGTEDEIKVLYEKLKTDHHVRFWFLANKNPEVAKSAEYWNQTKLRASASNVFGALTPAGRALKKLDAYGAAFERLRKLVEG